MVKHLTYNTISTVIGKFGSKRRPTKSVFLFYALLTPLCWFIPHGTHRHVGTGSSFRRLEEKVEVMALRMLFELEPQTKQVFGIEAERTHPGQELKESGSLHHVAVRTFHMFDAALKMLGPDTETLNEILADLGKRHIGYGVLAVRTALANHMVPVRSNGMQITHIHNISTTSRS